MHFSKKNNPRLLFIVSLPRSGSTVLTTMLDRYSGFLCLPESGFPQVLDAISDREFSNRDLVAALYQTSSFGGSVLTFEETLPCVTSDRRETLINIGLASAGKLGRPISSISWIVWKTTRLVTWWKSLANPFDRFLIVHRELTNVYESQFRVHFGLYNRNPWRFALFAASYLKSFQLYPRPFTIDTDYSILDMELPSILAKLESSALLRPSGTSAMEIVRNRFDFHSDILSSFENKDSEKLKQIEPHLLSTFKRALKLSRMVPPIIAISLRRYADLRVLAKIRYDSKLILDR